MEFNFTSISPYSYIKYGGYNVAEGYLTNGIPGCHFPSQAVFGGPVYSPAVTIDNNGIETNHLTITNGSSGITYGSFYLGTIKGDYSINSNGNGHFNQVWTSDGTVSKSDKKKKTHIKYLSEDNKIKDFIMSLQPVEYKWKDNGKRTHLGFYAQDVQQEALSTIGDTGL